MQATVQGQFLLAAFIPLIFCSGLIPMRYVYSVLSFKFFFFLLLFVFLFPLPRSQSISYAGGSEKYAGANERTTAHANRRAEKSKIKE
jgi:hypothetical protein